MADKNNDDLYVVKRDEGWAVTREDAKRASAVTRTQAEAISRAREIRDNSGGGHGDVRIQGRDGKFRDSDSGTKNETKAPDTR
jgi:hypothetical protein